METRFSQAAHTVPPGLRIEECETRFDKEHFGLFQRYIASRHGDGGMAEMGTDEYREMIERSSERTRLVEFRDESGRLVAASLTDHMRNGLSGVYKYFDPEEEKLSLGTFVILWHVERCLELGLEHVYLGYWIGDCRKMVYKTPFRAPRDAHQGRLAAVRPGPVPKALPEPPFRARNSQPDIGEKTAMTIYRGTTGSRLIQWECCMRKS